MFGEHLLKRTLRLLDRPGASAASRLRSRRPRPPSPPSPSPAPPIDVPPPFAPPPHTAKISFGVSQVVSPVTSCAQYVLAVRLSVCRRREPSPARRRPRRAPSRSSTPPASRTCSLAFESCDNTSVHPAPRASPTPRSRSRPRRPSSSSLDDRPRVRAHRLARHPVRKRGRATSSETRHARLHPLVPRARARRRARRHKVWARATIDVGRRRTRSR